MPSVVIQPMVSHTANIYTSTKLPKSPWEAPLPLLIPAPVALAVAADRLSPTGPQSSQMEGGQEGAEHLHNKNKIKPGTSNAFPSTVFPVSHLDTFGQK